MHKALIPMVASLAVCGAATTALVMSSAHAQPSPHKPVMVAEAATPGTGPDNGGPHSLRGENSAEHADRMKQICRDHYARQTGELAYLETRLDLTQAEMPLFDHWKQVKLSIAQRRADSCAQRPLNPQRTSAQTRPARPSPADRMANEETRLKQHLADMEAERPVLEAFYNSLSPVQKMGLNGSHRGMTGGMMRHARFAMGPRGPMGTNPGFMGRGPMEPPAEPESMGPPPER